MGGIDSGEPKFISSGSASGVNIRPRCLPDVVMKKKLPPKCGAAANSDSDFFEMVQAGKISPIQTGIILIPWSKVTRKC